MMFPFKMAFFRWELLVSGRVEHDCYTPDITVMTHDPWVYPEFFGPREKPAGYKLAPTSWVRWKIPKFFDSNKLRFHYGFICLVDPLIFQKCHIISSQVLVTIIASDISRTIFMQKSIIRALHAPTKIYPGFDGFLQDKWGLQTFSPRKNGSFNQRSWKELTLRLISFSPPPK